MIAAWFEESVSWVRNPVEFFTFTYVQIPLRRHESISSSSLAKVTYQGREATIDGNRSWRKPTLNSNPERSCSKRLNRILHSNYGICGFTNPQLAKRGVYGYTPEDMINQGRVPPTVVRKPWICIWDIGKNTKIRKLDRCTYNTICPILIEG